MKLLKSVLFVVWFGWCLAAWPGSRGLARHSTAGHVLGLNFRVRSGTGCLPGAVAAKTNMIVKPYLGLAVLVPCTVGSLSSLDFALERDGCWTVVFVFWRVGWLVVAG